MLFQLCIIFLISTKWKRRMSLLQTREIESDVRMTDFHFWMISSLNHHNCVSSHKKKCIWTHAVMLDLHFNKMITEIYMKWSWMKQDKNIIQHSTIPLRLQKISKFTQPPPQNRVTGDILFQKCVPRQLSARSAAQIWAASGRLRDQDTFVPTFPSCCWSLHPTTDQSPQTRKTGCGTSG